MPARREYTEAQRVDVLARLESGQSQRYVARETGIPLVTVNLWHSAAQEAKSAVLAADGVLNGETKTHHADRWSKAQRLAAERMASNVEALPETGLKPSEIRELAIVGGIATDKFLDLTEGRKGAQINVDARSVSLPPGLSVDDLRALALASNPVQQLNAGDAAAGSETVESLDN